MNKNNHAFTLIELLLVVSIVIVIMGLVLPALAVERSGSRQLIDI